jgi:hypothetical protein
MASIVRSGLRKQALGLARKTVRACVGVIGIVHERTICVQCFDVILNAFTIGYTCPRAVEKPCQRLWCCC